MPIPTNISIARPFVTNVIRRTFLRSADSRFLTDLKREQRKSGVRTAIGTRDTKRLFKWLVTMLSYQGISNRVAEDYMDRHGRVDWYEVRAVVARAACPKLQSYWHFEGCGYRKGAETCSLPDRFHGCGVPRFPLRNGRLNQTAVSLYLFIRDIADGNLIGWIERQLALHSNDAPGVRVAALLDPMRNIYGVSDKVLSMLLSAVLLGARRPRLWFETGASFVVVDTLVHNYLHRTGGNGRNAV